MAPQSQPVQTQPLTGSALIEMAWETAWEAAVRAFLVLLLGGIALGIVGDIFKQVTPSRPPVFGGKPVLEAEDSGHSRATQSPHWHWTMGKEQQFLLVAGLFFVAGLWHRVGQRGGAVAAEPTRREKMLKRISENWFGMIVGNAFGAMIAAMMLIWVQRFSWSQICWQWLLGNVFSALEPVARFLLGASQTNFLGRLFAWYGENQFRFAFWFFYLAAIGDDLGVPNFKALARWLGRRLRKRAQAPPVAASG